MSDRTVRYQVLMYWQPAGVDERMKCLHVGRPKLTRDEAEALGAVMLAEVDTFVHVEVVPTVAACGFTLPGFGLVCSKPHKFVIAGQHLCCSHVVRLYPDVIARGVETIEPQVGERLACEDCRADRIVTRAVPQVGSHPIQI